MGFVSPAAARVLLGRRGYSSPTYSNFVPAACAYFLLRGRSHTPLTPIVITPTPSSRYVDNLIQQTDIDYQDWLIDWSALAPDTITASRWRVDDPGLILSLPSFTETTTTIWIAGGEPDGEYIITNTVTTSSRRVLQKSFTCLIDE